MITSPSSVEDAVASAHDLQLITNGGKHAFARAALESDLPIAQLTVEDPVYDRPKTYEGVWLTDLLAAVGALDGGGDTVLFRAADGYETRMSFDDLASTGQRGLVAFRDLEAEDDWEPFASGKEMIVPAPYYLVWGSEESEAPTDGEAVIATLPWPYQLVEIEIIDFATTYDRLFPADVDEASAVYHGFLLFEKACLKCHSINLQGGTLGPEMNIPRNITEYRDRDTLVAFIKNSLNFRAGSKMPLFEDTLTDAEIDDILAYLTWANDHKWDDAGTE